MIRGEDQLCWKGNANGQFSVASAYESITEPLLVEIWKWRGPERIKILLWKFASNALLTNERRVNRRIASDPSCPRCGQNVENDDHVFRWNGNSKAIWYLDSRRSAAGGVFRN